MTNKPKVLVLGGRFYFFEFDCQFHYLDAVSTGFICVQIKLNEAKEMSSRVEWNKEIGKNGKRGKQQQKQA